MRDGLLCGVSPHKDPPRTSLIYLCGATVTRGCRVWSDHARIILGSVPHCKWGATCVSCFLRSTEFHCNLKKEDRSCDGNGVASGVGGQVAGGIALLFATLGSFPYCKWDCKWCCCRSCRWSFQGSPARNGFLRDNSCMKPCLKLTSWLLRLFGYWTGSRMFAFGRCSTEKCFCTKKVINQ